MAAPSRIILEQCCKLAKDYSARIITHIFQTDTAKEGVCRAVASSWIQAGLKLSNYPHGMTSFHKDADTTSTGQVSDIYVKRQILGTPTYRLASGYNNARDEYEKLLSSTAEATELKNNVLNFESVVKKDDDDVQRLQATYSLTGLPSTEIELNKAKFRLNISIAKYNKMASDYITTSTAQTTSLRLASKKLDEARKRCVALTVTNGELSATSCSRDDRVITFGKVKDVFCDLHCKSTGFYYVGLHKHAVALYFARDGACRFIDANTGEWAFSSDAKFRCFFPAYFDELYNKDYDNNEYEVYGFYSSVTMPSIDQCELCPFKNCPFGGKWTAKCQHKTEG